MGLKKPRETALRVGASHAMGSLRHRLRPPEVRDSAKEPWSERAPSMRGAGRPVVEPVRRADAGMPAPWVARKKGAAHAAFVTAKTAGDR